MRASAFAFACRWSAPSRPPTRWSPPASPWRPAPTPATVLPLLETLQGARGRLDLAGTAPGRRADLRRLRPYARRARQGTRRAAALCRQPAAGGVRLRRRPRQGQAARDGGGGGRQGGRRHRHRRQSAQRERRRHPPRDLGRLPPAPSRSATALRPSPTRSQDWGEAMFCWWPARVTRPGQTVGTTVIPFSDHDAVAAALKQEAKLWLSRFGP